MPSSKKSGTSRGKSPRNPGNRAQQSPTSPKPFKGTKTENRIERFVTEYLVDLNGRQAAIRTGYSPDSARFTASELLARPDVQERVAKAMVERANRTGITADRVLQRWWDIANADPAELIEHRRVCCRYCYGKNHRYQRTPREIADAVANFERAKVTAEAKGEPFPAAFDPQGGTGFDPRKDPNPNCPECFGQGEECVFPKDTRDLSPAAKLLYAGVKKTEKGFEIKMQSQQAALENIAKHLGMFTQTVKHQNDPENPIAVTGLVMIPAKASPDDAG